jgi:hypothetical protein
VPSSRSAVKKSHARIASAWERRNSDQVGPVRRGAGSIRPPSGSPIPSTPRLALPARPARRGSCGSPSRVFAGQPEDQGPDVPAGGRPVLPRIDLAAQRRRAMSRCQRRIVSGVTSSRSPCRRPFGITASRVATSARSSQSSLGRRGCRRCSTASWWRRIKISAVFHVSSRRASRSHAASRVVRRNMNRRHMTGDHRGGTSGQQLCWPEPWTRFSARTGGHREVRGVGLPLVQPGQGAGLERPLEGRP